MRSNPLQTVANYYQPLPATESRCIPLPNLANRSSPFIQTFCVMPFLILCQSQDLNPSDEPLHSWDFTPSKLRALFHILLFLWFTGLWAFSWSSGPAAKFVVVLLSPCFALIVSTLSPLHHQEDTRSLTQCKHPDGERHNPILCQRPKVSVKGRFWLVPYDIVHMIDSANMKIDLMIHFFIYIQIKILQNKLLFTLRVSTTQTKQHYRDEAMRCRLSWQPHSHNI